MTVPTAVAPATPQAAPLLDYETGAFFFSSPYGSLLARGTAATTTEPSSDWSRSAAELLAGAAAADAAPVVVGVLPFERGAAVRLTVPREVHRGRPPRWLPDVPPPVADAGWTIRPRPEPARFEAAVADAVAAIGAGRLEKVVLARSLELTGVDDVPVDVLLRRLADHNACGHVFAADVTPDDDPTARTLLGASPELLVSRNGNRVVSNPLAGSAPRHPDPVVDRARATALVNSAKDRAEHAVVIAAVAARLAPFCAALHVPDEPVLVRTPTMWHLSTRVTGTLADPSTTSLQLAQALHPTPAVGGVPVDDAVEVIRSAEGFDRGFYTGLVGWCDASGDGEWAIVLRCAEAAGPTLRLYAGAGIVADSQPAAELAETSAKFRTFLRAVGLEAEL
ncbi:MAG: hypothetical protein ABS81_03100 [Pseudonocardia sp. SCN 72-86]|nr:MAG: hypothetical protein ABS81_03100 [Pseudonocardia sp. SCN 72-86]